jgi:hypothetical protein
MSGGYASSGPGEKLASVVSAPYGKARWFAKIGSYENFLKHDMFSHSVSRRDAPAAEGAAGGAESSILRHFILKNRIFAKTGSGQTVGKVQLKR